MTTFLIVSICFIAGLSLQKFDQLQRTLTVKLNDFAIYIALPAIILATIPTIDISMDALYPVVSAWICMALSLLIFLPLGKRLGWSKETIIICVVLTGLGNTAFLGMALVKILLDDVALVYAIIYDQLGSFIVLSLTLPIVLAVKQGSGGKVSPLAIVKSILIFPPFISLMVAFFLPVAGLTEALQLPLVWLGNLLLPISMLVIGMQFKIRTAQEHRLPIALCLGTKMLLAPILVFAAGLGIGIQEKIFQATVVQSAMPPMVTPTVFLIGLHLAPRLAASILGFGTLIGFVTIPAIAFMLN